MFKKLLLLLALSTNSYAIDWQCIHGNIGCDFKRLKVPHGWVVQVDYSPYGVALTYVPDENHEWKVS